MNTILAALSLFAVAVSAHGGHHPVVFGLAHDARVLHHHAVRLTFDKGGHLGGVDHLGFLHLVPKLGHNVLKEGFASYKPGEHVTHDFLLSGVDDKHVLVDVVGFSDCEDWHATLLTLWHPQVGLEHKPHTFTDDDKDGEFTKVHVSGVDGFVDFVKGHVLRDHLKGLLEKGLPTHHVTVELLDEFPGLLL